MLFFFLFFLPGLIGIAGVNNVLSQFLKRPCIFDAEVADAGAAQRGEAGTVAQGFAEVVGEAADVSAFAASDLEVEFGKAVEVDF